MTIASLSISRAPGRPRKDPGDVRRPLSISMTAAEWDALDAICDIRGASRGEVVGSYALDAVVRERKKARPPT